MNKNLSLWQMSAEQFSAFDMHLYLDTHPEDVHAKEMFDKYQKNYSICKKQYEEAHGPVTANGSTCATWDWLKNPWPWEKEAN